MLYSLGGLQGRFQPTRMHLLPYTVLGLCVIAGALLPLSFLLSAGKSGRLPAAAGGRRLRPRYSGSVGAQGTALARAMEYLPARRDRPRDCGVPNGTFVNLHKVDRQSLSAGDLLQVGETFLQFRLKHLRE
jgi:hypothetical protein